MKPEHLSHKELLVRVRQLEQQNDTMIRFMESLDQLVEIYRPMFEANTDEAIRDFKKAKVVA